MSRPSAFAPCGSLRIGITGGIASGKSYLCHRLEDLGYRVFYCDDVAKQIIRSHPKVREELTALVGDNLYDRDGRLVKQVLAAYLCQGKKYSAQVDAIVHPRVAEAFHRECQQVLSEDNRTNLSFECFACEIDSKELTFELLSSLPQSQTIFMECALLFESGFDKLVDTSVLVHIPSSLQMERLMERDHISREKAEKWISLQLSEEEKMKRADYFISGQL